MVRALITIASLLTLSLPFLLIGPAPAADAAPGRWTGPTFKVATWNIRSGMGIQGFGTTAWSHDTLNCSDPAAPMNAWGHGLPQRELRGLAADTSIVALAIQEAWNCGSPEQVRQVLGFALATREQQGVALVARHGLKGDAFYKQIDAAEDRWVIGGDVCLDAGCNTSLPMFSTHWGAPTEEFPRQARALVAALAGIAGPHLFMGDLNVYRRDHWNPPVPCTGRNAPGRLLALDIVEAAGYRDAWKATQGGEGWTGMASRPDCGRPEGGLYKRIDYIFTKGLPVVATTRFAKVAPGADAPSDHAGVIAEIGRANHDH